MGLLTALISFLTAWMGFRREVGATARPMAGVPESAAESAARGVEVEAPGAGSARGVVTAGRSEWAMRRRGIGGPRFWSLVGVAALLVSGGFAIALANSGFFAALPQLISGWKEEAALREATAARLRGRVTVGDKPLARGRMIAQPATGEPHYAEIQDGAYRFAGLPRGNYVLKVELDSEPGMTAVSTVGSIELGAGDHERDYNVERPAGVREKPRNAFPPNDDGAPSS